LNAKVKLRLWLNFWQQNSAIAMNAVVTSHLPVYLYSAAGKKVNHQSLLHRTNSRSHPLNSGPQNPIR
jgi:SPX domain protein involved in polyphosphate accumulation